MSSSKVILQSHHVVEQVQLRDVELLRVLERHGLFDIDDSRNRLYLPVDGRLADDIESSPHRGRTRSSYNEGLREVLDDLAKTSDGKAALAEDAAALKRVADRIQGVQDTLKVAMINGDLFPTTPDRLSKQAANALNHATLANLDHYEVQHADQIQFLRRMGSVESEWAAVTHSEPRLHAVINAAQTEGRHLVAGPQELPEREVAGRMELRMAVSNAEQSNRLVLSESSSRMVTQVLVDDLPTIGAAKGGVYDLAAHPPASYKPMSQRGGIMPELLFGNPTAAQALRHAGVFASAVDATMTVQRAAGFYGQDNLIAAQSELAHFAGRNAGGWLGGTATAFALGTSSGAGPMALIAADAYLLTKAGEKAADWMDDRSVYVQTVGKGSHAETWEFTGRAWTRPGMVDVTRDGVDNPVSMPVAASYEKARELNCAATNASVGLALKALPPAQNPFQLPASASDRGSLSEAPWIRDPAQGQWHRLVKTGVSGENNRGSYESEIASPQRSAELDAQAAAVVASNVANSPAAVAARYDLVYERAGWAAHQLPRSEAAEKAAVNPDRLSTWDGTEYQRSPDGQWLREGVPATGNAALELEGTRTVLQASLREQAEVLDAVRSNPPSAQDIAREQMQYGYRMVGSELRPDWQEAITLATERTRSAAGLTGGATQLQPDEKGRFNVASPIAHLEIGDDGVRRVVAVTSSDDILLALREVHAREEAPTQEARELRVTTLSAQERVAHEQALREANRQGASATEATQAAAVAAQRVHDGPLETVRHPEPDREPMRPAEPPSVAAVARPQPEAAVLAAAHTVAVQTEPVRVASGAPDDGLSRTNVDARQLPEQVRQHEDVSPRHREAPPQAVEQKSKHTEESFTPVWPETAAAKLPQQPSAHAMAALEPEAAPHARPADPVPQHPPVHSQRMHEAPSPREPTAQRPITPLDPQHPDHSLYSQIREKVGELDAARGRSYDETSERLTGSLLVLAKSRGLERVDHVVLSIETPELRPAHNVFVVQGELNNPAHRRAHLETAQAISVPLAESLQKFELVRQEQQERIQQEALQQQQEESQQQGRARSM